MANSNMSFSSVSLSQLDPEEAERQYAQRKREIQNMLRSRRKFSRQTKQRGRTQSRPQSAANAFRNITDSFANKPLPSELSNTFSSEVSKETTETVHTQLDTSLAQACNQIRQDPPTRRFQVDLRKVSQSNARSMSRDRMSELRSVQTSVCEQPSVISVDLSGCQSARSAYSRGYNQSTAPLYQRSTQWKKERDEERQMLKEAKTHREQKECTFTPRLRKPTGPHAKFIFHDQSLPTYERNIKWLQEKEEWRREMQEEA